LCGCVVVWKERKEGKGREKVNSGVMEEKCGALFIMKKSEKRGEEAKHNQKRKYHSNTFAITPDDTVLQNIILKTPQIKHKIKNPS
jgi:hypothetical protein